ncbi:MAG: hypothetical protein JRI68_06580, partial [Deltaproteobacteria bacterium]|nr:hypothetical protein [Deltaproteobacteria bacterium]
RARFVAAALTSAGLAGAGFACTCLSVVRQPDEPPTVDTDPGSGDAAAPSAPEDGVDAGRSDGDETGEQDPEGPGPPRPCLQPPRPQICLSDDTIEGVLIDPQPGICLEAPYYGGKP